jgi:hypothetical protein
VQGQLITLGSQFYYGVVDDANKGFPGLGVQYDSANMTVDATGTTASTGSSVWLIKWGEDGVQWLFGNGSDPLHLEDMRIETVLDSNTPAKPYTAYVQELLAWVGLKLGSIKHAVRIKNLTADNGKGLTDNLVYDALSLFPAGVVPDVALGTRRSLNQLRRSRTATNQTGEPAPLPKEVAGVPFEVTDSILNTEAIA